MSCPPTPSTDVKDVHSASSSLFLTPQNSERVHGTVVFLREEGQNDFVPLHRTSSVTLQELVDEFNISSVVECDARGHVQARAVAFDSPSDVLHSGRHYVVRRDVRNEDCSSRVTFRGKIQVKEYELDHATPPAHRQQTEGQRPPAFFSAIGTPLPLGHRNEADLDDENSLSHTLVSGQKRSRAEMEGTSSTAGSNATDGSCDVPRDLAAMTEEEEESANEAPRPLFFSDRTNMVTAPPGSKMEAAMLTNMATAPSTAPDSSDANKENSATSGAASAAASRGMPLRFIPFPIATEDGESLITLEALTAMCAEDDTAEQQRRHEEALSILEGARRVLFKSP